MNRLFKIIGMFLAAAMFLVICGVVGAILACCAVWVLCLLLTHVMGNPDFMALLYLVLLAGPLGFVAGGLAGLLALAIFLAWSDSRPVEEGSRP